MKSIIVTGKTVEDAILAAVAQLSVIREKLDIEILEEPVKGKLFGIVGGKEAKIRATVKVSKSDKAKGFLNRLFQLMDVDATVDIAETSELLDIKINGPQMGIVIGHRGETLDAIQYLTSLAINKEKDKYKRVIIDTEEYRSKREETLKRLAKRLAQRVYKTKRRVVLEPMNPFERRVIHATLQNDPHVNTHSEGEEPYRKVVITLKQ